MRASEEQGGDERGEGGRRGMEGGGDIGGVGAGVERKHGTISRRGSRTRTSRRERKKRIASPPSSLFLFRTSEAGIYGRLPYLLSRSSVYEVGAGTHGDSGRRENKPSVGSLPHIYMRWQSLVERGGT